MAGEEPGRSSPASWMDLEQAFCQMLLVAVLTTVGFLHDTRSRGRIDSPILHHAIRTPEHRVHIMRLALHLIAFWRLDVKQARHCRRRLIPRILAYQVWCHKTHFLQSVLAEKSLWIVMGQQDAVLDFSSTFQCSRGKPVLVNNRSS